VDSLFFLIMRTNKEIQDKINELTPSFESAEESYFSLVEKKQKGEKISDIDFLKTENEYEVLKKEIETLEWTLNKE